jgi:hypothetical protein
MVFVIKPARKAFGNPNSTAVGAQRKPASQIKLGAKASQGGKVSAAGLNNKKSAVQTSAVVEPIAPEEWINDQADNAVEERKVSDSEPFLSLSSGYLNSKFTFCESPQFPEAARRNRQKLVKSKVLVTVGQYGGILSGKTIEGDASFRSSVYKTLGSMQFRQSYFMGKPIRIEGILSFTQNPANQLLCRDAAQELEVPTIIDGGVLNERAIACLVPEFPADARSANLKTVQARIQTVVDEQGKVISAKAIDGHPTFRESSERFASKATFPKSLITGKPVKVSGILVFTQTTSNDARCGVQAPTD